MALSPAGTGAHYYTTTQHNEARAPAANYACIYCCCCTDRVAVSCVMFCAYAVCDVPYDTLLLYCVGMARSASWLASTPPTGEQPHRSYLPSTHTLWYPSSSALTPMPLPMAMVLVAVAVAVAVAVVVCWDVRHGRKYQSARTSTCCQCAPYIQFDTDMTCTTPSEDASR